MVGSIKHPARDINQITIDHLKFLGRQLATWWFVKEPQDIEPPVDLPGHPDPAQKGAFVTFRLIEEVPQACLFGKFKVSRFADSHPTNRDLSNLPGLLPTFGFLLTLGHVFPATQQEGPYHQGDERGVFLFHQVTTKVGWT